MALSKTSKVWIAGLGGGVLVAAGGALLVTGVGSGGGGALIMTGLATIGGAIGGGALAGIGVIAAGAATAAAISSAIAHKVIKDPELKALAEKLGKANELYEVSRQVTEIQKKEMEELNRQIGDFLREKKKDQAKLDDLKMRLFILIRQLENKDAA